MSKTPRTDAGDLLEAGSDAIISACGTYRYWLQRYWRHDLPALNFVMLNPSTADASADDPTIRRCIAFARSLGFGRMEVTNLFALRSTDPKGIRQHPAPIGDENDEQIVTSAKVCQLTICGWGTKGHYLGRDAEVLRLLRSAGVIPHALRRPKDGHPEHPLYLPGDLTPIGM